MDRFPDDEVDVDVEQCSDSENAPRTPRPTSKSTVRSTSPPSPSDDERLTPEPAQVREQEEEDKKPEQEELTECLSPL